MFFNPEVNRTFDRVPRFDKRSRDFPAVRGTPIEHKKLRSYTWRCDTYLDQGEEGSCVGHGWAHELAARPAVIPATSEDAFGLYKRAQQIDEWAGEDYSGTSVLAGAKAVQEHLNRLFNALFEYRWCFGIEDLIRAIAYRGPVVLGVWWYDGMIDTDADGFVHMTGRRLGGHCVMAKGVKLVFPKGAEKTFANLDREASYVLLHNSWGRFWGEAGNAKISVADLDRLLQEDGEACIPVKRR